MISRGPSIVRLARFINGSPFRPDQLGSEGLPVVRIRQLLDETAAVDLAKAPADAVFISDGDLVFSWSATLAVRRWTRGRALLNQHLFRVDCRPDIEPRWMQYVLEEAIARLAPLMHGSAMTHITQDMLRAVTIACPLIARQRAIADYLDREAATIHRLIAAKRRMVDLVGERFRSWRERLLVSDTKVTWMPLHRLVDPTRPIVYGIVQPGDEFPGGVPFIKSGDVSDFRPELLSRTDPKIDHLYRRAHVFPQDIVIAMRASIGDAIMVPNTLAVANLTQGTARIAPAPGVDRYWLLCVLATYAVQGQCEVRAVGTTFKTLNIWDLRRLSIPTPDASTQQRLAPLVQVEGERIAQLTDQLNKQVELLRERRQALITAAVMGALEIPTVPT